MKPIKLFIKNLRFFFTIDFKEFYDNVEVVKDVVYESEQKHDLTTRAIDALVELEGDNKKTIYKLTSNVTRAIVILDRVVSHLQE